MKSNLFYTGEMQLHYQQIGGTNLKNDGVGPFFHAYIQLLQLYSTAPCTKDQKIAFTQEIRLYTR